MYHSDNVEAQGFVQHLKLPHYIDFQAELNLIRKLRQDAAERSEISSEIDHELNPGTNEASVIKNSMENANGRVSPR
ncbi:MAG: hypothetical protein Kow00121_23130 [Elainellaceae cyanobacterium]